MWSSLQTSNKSCGARKCVWQGKGMSLWSIITVNSLRACKVSFQHCLCKYYLRALCKLNSSTHWHSLVQSEEPERRALRIQIIVQQKDTLTVDRKTLYCCGLDSANVFTDWKPYILRLKNNELQVMIFCQRKYVAFPKEVFLCAVNRERICAFLVWLCTCKMICMLFREHKQDLNYGLSKFLNPFYSNVNASLPLSYANHFKSQGEVYTL